MSGERTSRRLTRRQLLRSGGVVLGGLALVPRLALAAPSPDPWAEVGEILARVRPPRFPERVFPVTGYGAVGDGKTDSTAAFRAAVQACSAAGGGHVVVPAGTYLTGAIHLLSNVDLHLEDGATIAFSQDPSAYLPVVFTRWQGIELMNYSPFVYAFGQRNVAVTGRGVLDGRADNAHWWPWKGSKAFGWQPGQPTEDADWNLLQQMADQGVPVEQRVFGAGHYLPPPLVEFYRCENVLIQGLTLRNSPFWQLHPTLCQNVTVEGVTASSLGPNNDGCDPESCSWVVIRGCTFDTGDDCIALKAGRNADGRRVDVPCEHVLIEGCHFESGHGAVTVGSEMTGGVRSVFARDCEATSTSLQNLLRFKTNSVRGGFIEDVHLRDARATGVSQAVLSIDFYYGEGDVGRFYPLVTEIEMRDVVVGTAAQGWSLRGYPEDPIGTVSLRNCDFQHVTGTDLAQNVRDLELRNVLENGQRVG
jgi:polygalacturonase